MSCLDQAVGVLADGHLLVLPRRPTTGLIGSAGAALDLRTGHRRPIPSVPDIVWDRPTPIWTGTEVVVLDPPGEAGASDQVAAYRPPPPPYLPRRPRTSTRLGA